MKSKILNFLHVDTYGTPVQGVIKITSNFALVITHQMILLRALVLVKTQVSIFIQDAIQISLLFSKLIYLINNSFFKRIADCQI